MLPCNFRGWKKVLIFTNWQRMLACWLHRTRFICQEAQVLFQKRAIAISCFIFSSELSLNYYEDKHYFSVLFFSIKSLSKLHTN